MFHLLISHIDINLNSHVTILFGFIFFHCLSYVLLAPQTKTVKKNESEQNTGRRSRDHISFHDKNEKASHIAQFYLCKIYFGKGKPVRREIKSAVTKVWG